MAAEMVKRIIVVLILRRFVEGIMDRPIILGRIVEGIILAAVAPPMLLLCLLQPGCALMLLSAGMLLLVKSGGLHPPQLCEITVRLPVDRIETDARGKSYFCVEVVKGDDVWSMTHRYSEFEALRSSLRKARSLDSLAFPKKYGMGAFFRCRGTRLEERRRGLEAWLNAVIRLPPPPSSMLVRTDADTWLDDLHVFLGTQGRSCMEGGGWLVGRLRGPAPAPPPSASPVLAQPTPPALSSSAPSTRGAPLRAPCDDVSRPGVAPPPLKLLT